MDVSLTLATNTGEEHVHGVVLLVDVELLLEEVDVLDETVIVAVDRVDVGVRLVVVVSVNVVAVAVLLVVVGGTNVATELPDAPPRIPSRHLESEIIKPLSDVDPRDKTKSPEAETGGRSMTLARKVPISFFSFALIAISLVNSIDPHDASLHKVSPGCANADLNVSSLPSAGIKLSTLNTFGITSPAKSVAK